MFRPARVRRGRPLVLSLVIVLMVSGCLGPRRADYESGRAIAVADPSDEADRLWDAIGETLRRRGLRLDRVDRQAGVVTTFPETSQHFFEFWRRDVNTRADLLEATVNPIRRRVEVHLDSQDGSWQRLTVRVRRERMSAPGPALNDSGAAIQHFISGSLPIGPADRQGGPWQTWHDLGRDPAMEEFLLREIFTRAAIGSTGNPDAADSDKARDR